MDFKKVVAGAFYYVGRNRVPLSKALAIPFIILILLEATTFISLSPTVSIIAGIISLAAQVFFAIITHRVVLLGPESVSKWGISSWTKRETYFLLHLIGLVLLIVPVWIVGFLPGLGWVPALLFFCWLFMRLSLVFPGIAIDKAVNFKLSWELTKKHQLLMFLVVIVFPIIMAIPCLLILSVLSSLLGIPEILELMDIMATVILVIEIAALSMAYKLITDEKYGNS